MFYLDKKEIQFIINGYKKEYVALQEELSTIKAQVELSLNKKKEHKLRLMEMDKIIVEIEKVKNKIIELEGGLR